jgi:hypothetical protein
MIEAFGAQSDVLFNENFKRRHIENEPSESILEKVRDD